MGADARKVIDGTSSVRFRTHGKGGGCDRTICWRLQWLIRLQIWLCWKKRLLQLRGSDVHAALLAANFMRVHGRRQHAQRVELVKPLRNLVELRTHR